MAEDLQRILLIEDDSAVAKVIRDGLDTNRYVVRHAPTLAEARALASGVQFDAMILDLMLPDGSGLDFAQALRTSGNDTPVLMLTARDTIDERVEGFRHGADDYLCKPFDVTELTARLEAILRRSQAGARHLCRMQTSSWI